MTATLPLALPLADLDDWSLLRTHGGAQVIFDAGDRSLLHADPADRFADHTRRYGHRPHLIGRTEQTLAMLEQVQLSGRGGAHFPVARKWRTALDAAAAGGGEVVVVGNGAEGEPGSVKDAALLLQRPHLVLDGLVCAAEALGASSAVLWLHEGAAAVAAVHRALAERRTAGLVEPPVRLAMGPDAYLSGEGNAVVRALDGGPALPVFLRRPAAVAGVDGRPTIVQNVETLARLALLARTGASGAPPGVVVSVLTRARDERWVIAAREVPGRRRLAEAVLDGYWVHQPPPRAVLVGGFGGRWMHWEDAAPMVLGQMIGSRTPGGLAPVSLAAGILAPLPSGTCGIRETAVVIDYLAASSARQCGPCVFGTRTLAEVWRRLARGATRRTDADRVRAVTEEISGRGACRLPDAAVSLTRSALEVFADDVERHLTGRACPVGGQDGPGTVLPVPVSPTTVAMNGRWA